MNTVKKNEARLEKEIRKLKRDNQLLQRENRSLKETNKWFKWLIDSYKKDIKKEDSYKPTNEKKSFVGKKSECDHKFVDSDRCVKCGWIP